MIERVSNKERKCNQVHSKVRLRYITCDRSLSYSFLGLYLRIQTRPEGMDHDKGDEFLY